MSEHRRRLPVNGTNAGQLLTHAARSTVSSIVSKVPFPYRAPATPTTVEPKQEPSHIGGNYDTEWARAYPARMARVLLVEGVLRPTMDIIASPTVTGLDRLFDIEGPVIFAANHHSHVDTPLLLSNIPEPWRHRIVIGAAADYFFGSRLTAPVSALVIGAIPIERSRVSRKSSDDAAALLDDGWSFLIFPEGGRSPDGWGQPFRAGAAYLSLRCEVPVVPVHLEGTSRIMAKGAKLPKPSPTTITFGAPLRPKPDEDSRRFGARIQAGVEQLADEVGTDWWTARQRAHRGNTPSLEGPGAVGAWRRTWQLGDRSPKRRAKRTWPDIR